MGQKGDLSDFGIVDVPDGLFRVFQELLIYWDFHTQPSLWSSENGLKKRKYPVSSSGQKCIVDTSNSNSNNQSLE